mmetsp:Transcript_52087/g.84148  ORF Transcript_52087/g.84148 Transcript_52087/m.84148 type:complete len:210 (+) Transcript_52087:706-1335(+)
MSSTRVMTTGSSTGFTHPVRSKPAPKVQAGFATDNCPPTEIVTALLPRKVCARRHSTSMSLISVVEAQGMSATRASTTPAFVPKPVPKRVMVSPILLLDGLMKAMLGMADLNQPLATLDSTYTPLAYSTRRSSREPDFGLETQVMRLPALSLMPIDRHGTLPIQTENDASWNPNPSPEMSTSCPPLAGRSLGVASRSCIEYILGELIPA